MARKSTKKDSAPKKDDYALESGVVEREVAAPALPYKPREPKNYHPPIGVIGCGGIAETHLKAYKQAGYNIVALCDHTEQKARRYQTEYYPQAQVYTDHRDVLRRDDVEVVDLTMHPPSRLEVIEAALLAGKHVLSQKPFVLDLDQGCRLADLADARGLKLAINQNGRWAPHFSYIRQAISAGLLGDVFAVHLSVHWDHNWIKDLSFDRIHHIALYDFGIHWFDMVTCFMAGRSARRVFASLTRSPSQRATPPLLAQAVIEFDHAQASVAFDADVRFGPQDRTYVAGSKGTITSTGPNLGNQSVRLHTADGVATPVLEGKWFPDGFHGAMAELLCAIEENRTPLNNARDNLTGLGLCFAAVASADSHDPQVPGKVRRLLG